MVDGDKLLVIADKKFIEMAEKRMEGVSPLYYELKKANSTLINNQSLYNGLKTAFSGGNIGEVSNNITKVWNSENITQEAINTVKWLTMKNNQVIDFAKTLWMPPVPQDKLPIIKSYTKKKVPYFFQYAKDKKVENCEEYTNSTMNNICMNIIDKKLRLDVIRPLAKIDYKKMVDMEYVVNNQEILNTYLKLNKSYGNKVKVLNSRKINETVLLDYLHEQMEELGYTKYELANSLAKMLYKKQTSRKKNLFWIMYGDIIIKNLEDSLKDENMYCKKCGRRVEDSDMTNGLCSHCRGEKQTKTIICQDCNTEFEVSKKNNKTTRCRECRDKIRNEKVRKNMENMRKNKMLS